MSHKLFQKNKNNNDDRDSSTLTSQVNKIFSSKSFHPIFFSIMQNLYITSFDKKGCKKQLVKVQKFLNKPEIPNLNSHLPPIGQQEEVPKKKKLVKKVRKKAATLKGKTSVSEKKSHGSAGSQSDSQESQEENHKINLRNSIKESPSTKPIKRGSKIENHTKNDSNTDLQLILEENAKLKEENSNLKKTIEEKEKLFHQRELLNLEAYKHFKEREISCKNQIHEVLELYKKQIESYRHLTKMNLMHSGSVNNLFTSETESSFEEK